jgi:hypothetical protein
MVYLYYQLHVVDSTKYSMYHFLNTVVF